MKIPKKIAEKVSEYQIPKEKADRLWEEVME